MPTITIDSFPRRRSGRHITITCTCPGRCYCPCPDFSTTTTTTTTTASSNVPYRRPCLWCNRHACRCRSYDYYYRDWGRWIVDLEWWDYDWYVNDDDDNDDDEYLSDD